MLDCTQTLETLAGSGVRFFTGVPDSLLKHFCACVQERCSPSEHVITPNEGNAIALAAGHHLATGETALVYMQNSGLGNAINPLVSMAGSSVYSIPMVLLIGWRGEPDKHDEPQHMQQGQITLDLLETIGIPHVVLPDEPTAATNTLRSAVELAQSSSAPTAIVVRKGTFASYEAAARENERYSLGREQVVQQLLASLEEDDVVISTTGKTSREVFEYRTNHDENPGRDFLTVGSMGHASQIALGVALAKPDQRIVCLDGDGALLMHMGSLAAIGQSDAKNVVHVCLNNGAHDSVGGQPTVGFDIDLTAIAAACGYRTSSSVATETDLRRAWVELSGDGPHFIEVRVKRGARADLGRPTSTPAENKQSFMEFVAQSTVAG